MPQAMIMPKKYFFDKDGNPLAYGKVYTYQTLTVINKDTFTTENGDIANTNPVILNGEGYATIYLDGSYKIIVDDQDDNNIWTEDPVSSSVAEEWIDCKTASYVSTNTFKVVGNSTGNYEQGRRVRIDNNTAQYSYSTIQSSSFAAGYTDVILTDAVVDVGVIGACVSIVGPNSRSTKNVLNMNVLQDLIDSNLVQNGDSVNLSGRNSISDGGGGMVDIIPAGTTSYVNLPNSHNVIQLLGVTGLVGRIRFDGTVEAERLGALSDGTIDSTPAISNGFNAGASVVTLENKGEYLVKDLVLDLADSVLEIGSKSSLLIDITGVNPDGVTVTGNFSKIKGGQIKTSVADSVKYIVNLNAFGAELIGVEINDPVKSTYVGDGINIPYNQGCVGVNQPNCLIERCNLYYATGAGIYNNRENTRILNNRIHDNISGVILAYGGSTGFGSDVIISENLFLTNNAGASRLSGANAILSVKETNGHTISANIIKESGEHGTYIQSTDTTVTGNTVSFCFGSGLKFGGGFNSTCQGNTAHDNVQDPDTAGVDDADYYFQSPTGNTSIVGNISRDSASYGIRVVWLENKEVPTEESKIVIASNIVTGAALISIRAMAIKDLVISGNACDGIIQAGQSTANAPIVEKAVVDSNTATTLIIDKTNKALVKDNTVDDINVNSGAINAIVKDNVIAAQVTRINLNNILEFSGNTIEWTDAVNSLFEQAGNAANSSNKRFIGNKFNSAGGRFVFFTSATPSGDNNTFINNEFSGSNQAVYTWGDNHMFIGNRSTDASNLGFIRGTNCIVTNNMGTISVETPVGNVVENNLVAV